MNRQRAGSSSQLCVRQEYDLQVFSVHVAASEGFRAELFCAAHRLLGENEGEHVLFRVHILYLDSIVPEERM